MTTGRASFPEGTGVTASLGLDRAVGRSGAILGAVANRLDIEDLKQRLLRHDLYERLTGVTAVRAFMEVHVFAVWDFLSLLKALQQRFTCVEVPWIPRGDPEIRRMINQIVLDEESDVGPSGAAASHLELYLDAMRTVGANVRPIESFLKELESGNSVEEALAHVAAPVAVSDFVGSTLRFVGGPSHELAAAFAYGREELIPPMFVQVVAQLAEPSAEAWEPFRYYLQRHIERDDEVHAPLARKLVARLCASDAQLWSEAQAAARASLQARLALWDYVSATIATG